MLEVSSKKWASSCGVFVARLGEMWTHLCQISIASVLGTNMCGVAIGEDRAHYILGYS